MIHKIVKYHVFIKIFEIDLNIFLIVESRVSTVQESGGLGRNRILFQIIGSVLAWNFEDGRDDTIVGVDQGSQVVLSNLISSPFD